MFLLFILIIVAILIVAVPSYILGIIIATNKHHENIGELYISTENGQPICYMALNDVDILKSLHDGELVFMMVKHDSQNSQLI